MRIVPPDEGELREILDTITSKTLAGDISKETSINLLSDLMATQALDRVAAQASEESAELDLTESKYQTIADDKDKLNSEDLKEIEEKKNEEPVTEETDDFMKKADTDFYTRSMDLSDKDFSMADDFDDKQSMPVVLKILIILVVLAIIVAGGFYIYMHYFK